LHALVASDVDIVTVVTNPDKPAGRKMELRPSPVKKAALDAGLQVLQPQSARSDEFHDELAKIAPDIAVVVAYGKILPAALLGVPPQGFVNLHFSLLPAYRGAAPVQRALMDGAEVTGVSVMVLTEGMDEGPVLVSEPTKVDPNETTGELGERLAHSGAQLLVDAIRRYVTGELLPEPQDDSQATYAPKVTTEDARIDWRNPAGKIHDLVRGLNPDPVAWTEFRGGRVRILRTEVGPDVALGPGVLSIGDDLQIGTGDGTLRIVELQMPGKKPARGADVGRGLRLEPGEGFS
jgi:methionyl-tRNA formyltransferase